MGRISMPQGKGSQLHNKREYKSIGRDIPEHIDSLRTHENVTLVDIPIKQAYDELFGEALAAYNAKQKRSDRKIDDYCEHIKKSKNGEKLFYEDVVQWGSVSDFTDEKTRQKAKKCLIEYVNGFEERNPTLKLIGAYIHMDEASPHLHLDYIPVATGYKRGLSVRNSFSKALHEMGFEQDPETRKDNAAVQWKKHERAVFGDICAAHGLEVEEERAARGSLSVDEYKEARDKMLEPIKQEMQPYQQLEIDTKQVDVKGKRLAGLVVIKDKDLKILKEQAKAYTVNRERIKNLNGDEIKLADWASDNQRATEQLNKRAKMLTEQEQQVRDMYERQRDVNVLLDCSEASVDNLLTENQQLKKQIEALQGKLAAAYKVLSSVIQAIHHVRDMGLSDAQYRIIGAVKRYAQAWAQRLGFDQAVNDMEKSAISPGIRDILYPSQQRSHQSVHRHRDDYER